MFDIHTDYLSACTPLPPTFLPSILLTSLTFPSWTPYHSFLPPLNNIMQSHVPPLRLFGPYMSTLIQIFPRETPPSKPHWATGSQVVPLLFSRVTCSSPSFFPLLPYANWHLFNAYLVQRSPYIQLENLLFSSSLPTKKVPNYLFTYYFGPRHGL